MAVPSGQFFVRDVKFRENEWHHALRMLVVMRDGQGIKDGAQFSFFQFIFPVEHQPLHHAN